MSGWPSSFSVVSRVEAAVTVAVSALVASTAAWLAVRVLERHERGARWR